MSEYSLFTSESVSEGHPDKIADQISDAVLDAIIAEDKFARVACETLVKTGVAIIAGEVTTSAWVDLEQIVRDVILGIGYNSSDVGFDGATCVHPSIVPILNAAFAPTPDEIASAERVAAAAQTQAGAFSVDGRMVDAPVIARARSILAGR